MRAHVIYLLRLVVGACLMLVVGNTAADALDLRWKDIENYDHLNIVHWFDVEADRADAVFYGTSATRHAIVSELVAERAGAALGREVEVWNLCLPGATPEIATAYVEDLFGADKPRIFFLEATPFFWNSRRKGQGPETYWRWFAGLEDFIAGAKDGDIKYLKSGIQGLDWGWESIWNIPSSWLRRDQVALQRQDFPRGGIYRLQDLGADLRGAPVEDQNPQRAISRINPLATKASWRRLIPRLAEACRAQDVRLVLVNIPLYEGLKPEFEDGSYEAHIAWMTEACEAAGVEFLDLDARWTLGSVDFRDYIHYSPTGAKRYSERFADEILVPLLREEEAAD